MTETNSISHRPMVGAVDLGSNTIKLTVARPDPHGGIEELALAADTVRLGAGLGTTGRLAEDRIDAALTTLREYAAIARSHGATRLVGVATEATRKASNGLEFLQRVREETGWDVRVIDGDTEADLTFRGLAATSDLSGKVVIADVGGGSTELIEAESGSVNTARSVAIGSGTLTDSFVVSDPPTATELAACADAVTASLGSTSFQVDGSARLIAVGGTAEYMAQLIGGGKLVDLADIQAALITCQKISSESLASLLAIQLARARVLPAGIVVIHVLANRLGVARVEIAPSGIRTGLLLEAFAELQQESAPL